MATSALVFLHERKQLPGMLHLSLVADIHRGTAWLDLLEELLLTDLYACCVRLVVPAQPVRACQVPTPNRQQGLVTTLVASPSQHIYLHSIIK